MIDWNDAQLTDEKNALRERLVEASENGKQPWWNERAWQRFTKSRRLPHLMPLRRLEITRSSFGRCHGPGRFEALGASLGRPITASFTVQVLRTWLVADKDTPCLTAVRGRLTVGEPYWRP